MNKKKMSKKTSQRWHSKWAMHQRYGVFCNRYLYHYITDMLQAGKSELLVTQSNTREIHRLALPVEKCQHSKTQLRVPLEGTCIRMYVVYNPRSGELRSVLPWYASDADFMQDYQENHDA